jgi:hypothetical protein
MEENCRVLNGTSPVIMFNSLTVCVSQINNSLHKIINIYLSLYIGVNFVSESKGRTWIEGFYEMCAEDNLKP